MNEQTPAAWVVETDDEHFQQDVIERSVALPVVVDFWAEWCAPCRMLGPALEELAQEYAGKFVLVKANTEQAQTAAGQFNVSSIPAVFGIVQGEPVDAFMGALGKEQIRPWLDRLIHQSLLAQAAVLEHSDASAAESQYRALYEASPNDSAAAIGLARTLLAQDRDEECREVLQLLSARGFLESEAEKLKTQLDFRGFKSEDVSACRAAVASHPNDLSRRLKLAEVLAANQQYREAFDIVLELLSMDRQGVGEAARQMMVEAFRLLPEDSELLSEYRRKLSMVLF